ncbi:hypothetical protein RJT34_09156 [Clitoria ternatea]|uniref:Cation/H+ exchanger transmembrane domain-containing protein n=1 Tax=Clitoria ternatea TaxID=43366 RepID=A0AAN9K5H1_CLITE
MPLPRGNGTVSVFYDWEGELKVCIKNDRGVGSFGVFFKDHPLDFVLPVTLLQLIIFIVISRAIYFLLRPLKTPTFICNLLGGIVLGPSCIGLNKNAYWEALFPPMQKQYLLLSSLIGASYFLFFIGLKMDILTTMRTAKSTWRLGVMPFLASLVVTLALLNQYHHPHNFPTAKSTMSHTATSIIMSFSNFPVVSDALIELNLIATELGQMALSSSMINDNILWFFLITSRAVLLKNLSCFVTYLVCFTLFTFFSFFILRPALKWIARTTPTGEPVKEIYVVLILLGALTMTGASDFMGLSFPMGPLVFGLAIPSGAPLGTTIVEKSELIIMEFLLPFFFVYIGMNTNLAPLQNWRVFFTLQGIFTAGDLAKLLTCVLVCQTYDIKPKHGTILGLMLNLKGITQLIGLARAQKLGVVDDYMFSQMVFCVLLNTSVFVPLIKLLYKHCPRVLHAPNFIDGQLRTIQGTPKNSEFLIICCVHNEGNVSGITHLLEACSPVLESPICTYVIQLIELLGKSAPILLPINYKHSMDFMSVTYPHTSHIMRAFINYSNNSSGPVTVLPYVNVAPYKSMHDAVCNLAQDKMVPFIIIPFHENDNIDLVGKMASSIRKMNTRFQARTPCTLGILVDRYSRLGASHNSNLFFNVGIFFVGGPDDREALALGLRMSSRANTRVSLFRFLVKNKQSCDSIFELDINDRHCEERDMRLDEALIDEFKDMKYVSGNVSWYEIAVEDGVGVLDAIHGLEGNYDLVMVGKRHDIGSLNDEEMSNFIENAETLGIFGDLLSSREFCLGMVPVLVTQCGGKGVNKLDRLGSGNISKISLAVDKQN